RPGPSHGVAGAIQGGAVAPPGGSAAAARTGPRGGGGVGGATGGPRPEVSPRGPGVGVAVGVSGDASVRRSKQRPAPPPSFTRNGHAACLSRGRRRCGDHQGGELSHAPALIRYAFTRSALRHSTGAGAAGPRRWAHND